MSSNSEWEDLKAQEAAYLKAQFRWSQKEIATALNLSQSKISRLLTRATDKNWLQTQFVPVGISPARQEEIRRVFQPQKLHETLQSLKTDTGVRIRNVRSFDSGGSNPQEIGARLRKFGLAAAARLEELLLLHEIETFGVTFGETVTRVVDGLGTLHSPHRRDRPIQFVPVCAELVRHVVFEFSSTRLAHRLREIVNDGEGDSLSLAGLPAYLPRAFFEKKTKALGGRFVAELLGNNSTYQKIFLGQNPLVQRLDGVLTSIGPSERTLGLSRAELLEAAQLPDEQLRALIVGDIGGALIPRASLRNSGQVDLLNEMWTGIRLKHVVELVHRAAVEGKLGVIVVAIGSDKANVLKEILMRGWVNELIVDKDLEKALVQLF